MNGPPPWVTDPLRFAEDPRLDAKARHVLRVLALRARDDGSVRGGEWLAEATAMHRNSVSSAIADLEQIDLVTVTRRPRHASVYSLRERAMPKLRPVPQPQESGTACTPAVQRETERGRRRERTRL